MAEEDNSQDKTEEPSQRKLDKAAEDGQVLSSKEMFVFTSLIIVLFIGNPFIRFFSTRRYTDPIRDDGPSDHIIKKIGTPTMGGLIILTGLILSVLMWADLTNIYVLFALYIAISFGALGAYDDYKKIKFENSSGISSKLKIFIQIILSLIHI